MDSGGSGGYLGRCWGGGADATAGRGWSRRTEVQRSGDQMQG